MVQGMPCVGKVSLGAALPVVSVMGVECSVLPTAVLSKNTAAPHEHFRDMTADIRPILDAWEAAGITFDAICTGYLGSVAQTEAVGELIDRFRGPQTKVLIDPVMGDNGALYRRFDDTYVAAMRELVRRADVVLPNLTEAAALAGVPYSAEPDVRALAEKLTQLGAGMVVITGVKEGEDRLGAAGYDARTQQFTAYTGPKLPGSYFGTGDIFGAVLTASLAKGAPLEKGLQLAVDFVCECIRVTLDDPQRRDYATSFELALGTLAQWAQQI